MIPCIVWQVLHKSVLVGWSALTCIHKNCADLKRFPFLLPYFQKDDYTAEKLHRLYFKQS